MRTLFPVWIVTTAAAKTKFSRRTNWNRILPKYIILTYEGRRSTCGRILPTKEPRIMKLRTSDMLLSYNSVCRYHAFMNTQRKWEIKSTLDVWASNEWGSCFDSLFERSRVPPMWRIEVFWFRIAVFWWLISNQCFTFNRNCYIYCILLSWKLSCDYHLFLLGA